MNNKGLINTEELKIQGLLDRYLRINSTITNTDTNHLDDDSLNAFVEGNLSEKESPIIVHHLTNCSFCLHRTGELAKLSYVFSENELIVSNQSTEPTKISTVLSGLMSKIFGASDSAVFAHEEKFELKEETEEKPKSE